MICFSTVAEVWNNVNEETAKIVLGSIKHCLHTACLPLTFNYKNVLCNELRLNSTVTKYLQRKSKG